MAGTELHALGTGRMDDITYVGLDVHKATVCVAGRRERVRWPRYGRLGFSRTALRSWAKW
jgi:hypothetical protein